MNALDETEAVWEIANQGLLYSEGTNSMRKFSIVANFDLALFNSSNSSTSFSEAASHAM